MDGKGKNIARTMEKRENRGKATEWICEYSNHKTWQAVPLALAMSLMLVPDYLSGWYTSTGSTDHSYVNTDDTHGTHDTDKSGILQPIRTFVDRRILRTVLGLMSSFLMHKM